jgi:1-acyl-sn-glycerol-3-phosphate acyltransferase
MDQASVLDNPKYTYLIKKQSVFFCIWKKLFYYYTKFVFLWYTPLKVYGRENIPNTSFIYSCNHNSHMDVALLAASVNKSFNYFGMLAAKDYWFDNRFKRFFMRIIMNLIPIDRKVDGIRNFSIDDTIALCNTFMAFENRNLIMFPEGTRGNPGEMRHFKTGGAIFAIKLNVPILPALVFGSHKAWPKGKIFMRPTPIQIHILDPIYPEQFIQRNSSGEIDEDNIRQTAQKMTTELENTIREKGKVFYG